jgi:cytochrome c-type biogenesis protein CcmF
MTEAAIDAGFWRHLYVSMGDAIGEDVWTMRIYHKPLVGWIWGGCLMMAFGGFLALLNRRYRAGATVPGAGSVAVAPSPAA